MNYTKTDDFLESSNGTNRIAFYNYKPLSEPKAVVQITHGMNEAIKRYDHFADFFAEKGIAVVGHDHLGHGKSVENDEDYGYFAAENGYMRLVDDLAAVAAKAREIYPKLPLTIFAHSMGTFVTRLYITEYANDKSYPDACILCGTSGPVRAVGIGLYEAERAIEKHGDRYRSKTLNKRISSGYNKRYPKNLSPFDWLSRDEEVVEKYVQEKETRFIFTAAGFRDLFTMVKLMSRPEWYSAVPKNLPLHLIAGEMDPVGQFGRGVTKVYEALKKAGADVTLKLYPECRHELINELNKEEIFEDVYMFLQTSLGIF